MSNYSSRKLELLALKWAVTDTFREYLLGNKVTVFTDTSPFTYLKAAKFGAVEKCWVSELAAFDFEVKYRPGTTNRNADVLSQQPIYDLISSVTPGIQVPNTIQEQKHRPQIPPQDLVTTLTIQALPMREKADLQALKEADHVIGAFKFYWQRETCSSKQELTIGPKDVRKLVQQ